MSESIEKLNAAMQKAMANRPKVGGFPYLAACLQDAGVKHNIWYLPSAESRYIMDDGVMMITENTPMVNVMSEVPAFSQEALVKALRTDQAGESTFREFLQSSWEAGVISYDVDFGDRTVTYHGSRGERYVESYPAVAI